MQNKSDQKTVLVLEDEPIIGKIVKRTLTKDGMTVEVAPNGLIAREKIDAAKKFDLYIFDIKTPVINGIQLFEYLEQNYPEETKKVIFATGDNLNASTAVFLEKIKRPYILKPYTPTQLKNLIQQVLNPGGAA